ncbi:MAG TPA: hypothetical protein VII45_02305 [Solirubrobacterales bacterium]
MDAAAVYRNGLCDICLHQRLVPNTRGSVFSLCERSRADPRYPRVPVGSCPGHESRDRGAPHEDPGVEGL